MNLDFRDFIESELAQLDEIIGLGRSIPAIVKKHDDDADTYTARVSYFLRLLAQTKQLLYRTFLKDPLESDAPILDLPNADKIFRKDNPESSEFLTWVRGWHEKMGGRKDKFSDFDRILDGRLKYGSGTRGKAYFIPPIVVKITQQQDEAEVAQVMKEYPDSGLTVLDVKWVKSIGTYAIIHKFVSTKLPQHIDDALDVIGEYVHHKLRVKAPRYKLDTIDIAKAGQQAIDTYNKSSTRTPDAQIQAKMEELRPHVEAILAIIQKIYRHSGVVWHDVKRANFGHVDGKAVILDPGQTTRYVTTDIPKIDQI